MNKITKILGIFLGIAIIVVGCNLLKAEPAYIRDSAKFGADFYTEIYGVTRNVGQAVNNATQTIAKCIGWLIICIGGLTVVNYSNKLADQIVAELAEKNKKDEPTPDYNALPDL